MQTEVKKLEGLKHKLTVTIPEEDVKAAYQKRLKEVSLEAKIPGFRPGKVDVNLIEKKFGKGVCQEVAGQLVQTTIEEAVTSNELLIAGTPKVEPGDFSKDKAFSYVAYFDIYPQITLCDFSSVTLEKSVAEVTEMDINKMLENMQRQQADWEAVDRVAANGDRLVIDFDGFIDKERFEGGSAKDFTVELGSNQMIPGFEEGLLGAKLGETTEVNVTFPKTYPVENLADKKAVFEVTVHKIEAPKLPELNDTFAEKVGIKEGGLDALKKEVRLGMERELTEALEQQLKSQVLDKLLELNSIDVPEALLEMEIQNLQKMTRQQMAAQQGKDSAPEIDLPRDPYVDQAKRRVSLGLLLAEVIKAYDIKVDNDLVRTKIESIAKAYRQPEEVVDWYFKNPQMLSEVEALVVEDQAVQQLIGQATLNEKPSSYEEVVKVNNQ